ncbi:MAG: hypothetical protein NVS3B19_20910 [Ginsengibacter sp.]
MGVRVSEGGRVSEKLAEIAALRSRMGEGVSEWVKGLLGVGMGS